MEKVLLSDLGLNVCLKYDYNEYDLNEDERVISL
jgi:hypothetical protein